MKVRQSMTAATIKVIPRPIRIAVVKSPFNMTHCLDATAYQTVTTAVIL
jgi:hypothetical protein